MALVSTIDEVHGLSLESEYRRAVLDHEADAALEAPAEMYVSTGSRDRFVLAAGRLGSRAWGPIAAMPRSTPGADNVAGAVAVFRAADQPGFHRACLHELRSEMTGLISRSVRAADGVPGLGTAEHRVAAVSVHPWFQTMFDLSQTTSPVELWTALLIPHGTDTSWDASEPYALLKRMHAADSTSASITALLLCTDHRWRGAAHRLIRQLSGSGMLDEQDLRRLSEWFMAVEVHVCAPRRLFPRGRVVSVVDVAVRDCAVQDDAPASSGLAESPTVHAALVDSLSAEAPVVELPVGNTAAGGAARNRRASMVRIARPVWPALKRWAAAHQVRSGTRSWDELFAFAAGLRASESAALLAGVMDAAYALPPDHREGAVQAAMASRQKSVRLAALPVVASLYGIDEAIRRASDDPSASVRAWARSASRPKQSKSSTSIHVGGPSETPPVDQSEQIQPTLF